MDIEGAVREAEGEAAIVLTDELEKARRALDSLKAGNLEVRVLAGILDPVITLLENFLKRFEPVNTGVVPPTPPAT